VAGLLLAAGCTGGQDPSGTAPTTAATASTTVPGPATAAPVTTAPTGPASVPPASAAPAPVTTVTAGACHARGTGEDVLPDTACTPGATDPAVTPATIASTICRSGWTATVRPPESVTETLKRSQLAAYGETGPISAYEEDHLIPLELGGAPADPSNLWPEPGASPNPKDDVESAANRAVCDGRLGLAQAQQAIASDWIALGLQLGVTGLAPG
jgi:hypothetical protein